MLPHCLRFASRRRFLQLLAASPLIGQGAAAALAQALPARPVDPMVWAPRDLDAVITDPKNALDCSTSSRSRRRTCRRGISASWSRAPTTR